MSDDVLFAAAARHSIAGVSEARIARARAASPGAAPGLLIEVPHGASTRAHFDAVRRRIRGPLPQDLEAFFFVNTDVGAFETALRVADLVAVAVPTLSVLVMRSLIPRTFIDCNRVAARGRRPRGPMTPALPEYIVDSRDVELLLSLHAKYVEASSSAFRIVCGERRPALVLHTYAPRTIDIDRIDENVVEALRRAYAPDRYPNWPRRPDVDVISETADGTPVAPRALVENLRRSYACIGVEVTENASYRLSPDTMGHVHSTRYPGRVLCMEINRELLAEPFTPFEEMEIGEDKVARMARPLAAAIVESIGRG